MRAALAIGLLLTAAATAPAMAAEPQRPAANARCANDPKSTTYGMQPCLSEEIQRQDARLNGAYAGALQILDPATKLKLRAAQRAWIAFRDADCEAVQASYSGAIAPIMQDTCYLERTSQRADELEDFAKP